MKKRIEKVLRQVINVSIRNFEHNAGLTIATLDNGNKWIVNDNTLDVDIWAKNENNELKNTFMSLNLKNFKQWDM